MHQKSEMEAAFLRLLPKNARKSFIQLDSFPKVQKEITSSTSEGGLVSIILIIFSALLITSELIQWQKPIHDYFFYVDFARGQQLEVNIDITIAMECKDVRVDILDFSGQNYVELTDLLSPSSVIYESKGAEFLNKKDTQYNPDVHKIIKQMNREIRKRQHVESVEYENAKACRYHGTFPMSKIKGLLHFTAPGYPYNPDELTPITSLNFTHRIDSMSFGKYYPGLENPLGYIYIILDDTQANAQNNLQNFKYFLGLVPTIYIDRINFFTNHLNTMQYAVTEYSHNVVLDGPRSDSLPGIYFLFGIEPITLTITARKLSTLEFLTRISGIVGGIFVVVGMLLKLCQWISALLRNVGRSKKQY